MKRRQKRGQQERNKGGPRAVPPARGPFKHWAAAIAGVAWLAGALFLGPTGQAVAAPQAKVGGEVVLKYTASLPEGGEVQPYGVQPEGELILRLDARDELWWVYLEPKLGREVKWSGEVRLGRVPSLYLSAWAGRAGSGGDRADPFGLIRAKANNPKADAQVRLGLEQPGVKVTLDQIFFNSRPDEGPTAGYLILDVGPPQARWGVAAKADLEETRDVLAYGLWRLGQWEAAAGAGTRLLARETQTGAALYARLRALPPAGGGPVPLEVRVYRDGAFDYVYHPEIGSATGTARTGAVLRWSWPAGRGALGAELSHEWKEGTEFIEGPPAYSDPLRMLTTGGALSFQRGIWSSRLAYRVTDDDSRQNTEVLEGRAAVNLAGGKAVVQLVARRTADQDGGITVFNDQYAQPILEPPDPLLDFVTLPAATQVVEVGLSAALRPWAGGEVRAAATNYDLGAGESLQRLSLKLSQGWAEGPTFTLEAGRDRWDLSPARTSGSVPGQIEEGTPVYLRASLVVKF